MRKRDGVAKINQEPREDVEALRKFIDGHRIVVDDPDETFHYELAPSARPAREALDALLARLEQTDECVRANQQAAHEEWTRAEALKARLEQTERALQTELRAVNTLRGVVEDAEARAVAAERALREIADMEPNAGSENQPVFIARAALASSDGG